MGVGSPARLLAGNRARLDRNILRQVGGARGYAHLWLVISPGGRVTRCDVRQGTGYDLLDRELCRVMLVQSRWEPARDRAGNPIGWEIGYTATWTR